MCSTPPLYMTGRSGTAAPDTRRVSCPNSGLYLHRSTLISDCGVTVSNSKYVVFRFNNGWIIKIGRGLDYFKRPKVGLQTDSSFSLMPLSLILLMARSVRFIFQGRFSIGYCDYDLRQCQETSVDIFHTQHTKTL